MLLAKGVIGHIALPLALAAAGGGLLATAEAQYDQGRADVRHALHLDWEPESNAPRSSGEIACWQRRDNSVRESEVATDYRGNVYVQDQRTSRLRELKLDPGFKLERDSSDWMSRKLVEETTNAEHLP
jgi:hypothetical protein